MLLNRKNPLGILVRQQQRIVHAVSSAIARELFAVVFAPANPADGRFPASIGEFAQHPRCNRKVRRRIDVSLSDAREIDAEWRKDRPLDGSDKTLETFKH